ncbi:MAG: noncanonical pyrimidine nucleotidase, YjjG family [Acidimicrobiaceae bacterium]|nr:noncanonical pyrimidine nucleotidase, YjjG family [Acidimicrobiaceae bacterium]
MYSTILLDLDHTLYDSDESERLAYAHTAATFGLDDPDRHFDTYVDINRAMWAAVERGELQPTEVRHRRFEQFNVTVGLDADPVLMADTFVWGLGAHGELYPGTVDVLAALASRASLGLVTNGLSDVQRSRLSRLGIAEYFDAIVVSSEVGATKPRPEIFDIAFEQLGRPAKETALMVGDSLTSDVAGGFAFGIATCWYNPHRKPLAPDSAPTHEIGALSELLALL